MIEIPEAFVLARQLTTVLSGKVIRSAVAAQSPHAFAWYSGDPADYASRLSGKSLGAAVSRGGMVEMEVEDVALLFTDGINLRYHSSADQQPCKHQLLVEFEDATSLSATVAMYGGLWCFSHGSNDNPYYLAAHDKPSPLTDEFNDPYFSGLFLPEHDKLSLKAFLATQQRIPGLGNGVLQDILYRASLHPKRKVNSLKAGDKEILFKAVKDVLSDMAQSGGRDTERDLFGNPGGYGTCMSKNTVGKACPACGSLIQKQAYLGGSIYFCPGCQKE